MLYSKLKFVQLFAFFYEVISNFPFNRGMKAMAAKGIYLDHFVNKWRYFKIWVFDSGCKKIFKTTLNHYNMQKLFMFPIILLFHPNIEDRQDLNLELRKLNENNRNGKQEHWKGLNLTITSNTSMITSINGKNYQICYRTGVINDFIIRSLKFLGHFNRFGYFRLV